MMDIFSFFDLPNLETLETKDGAQPPQPAGRRSAPTEDSETSHPKATSAQVPPTRQAKSDTSSDTNAASQPSVDRTEMSSNYLYWMVP